MKDREQESNLRILKGSLIGYLSLAVNILSGIVYTPWMIRQIGDSSYGLYTLAVSIINMLLIDFGIGEALSRFAARYRARQDEEGLRRFAGLVYKLYLGIDAVVLCISTVIFFFLDAIYASLSAQELATFRIVYVMVIGYNLFAFPFATQNGILSAFEEFVVLKASVLLTRVLTIVIVIAALSAGGGLYSLVLAHIISGAAAVGLKWWVLHKKLHFRAIWSGFDRKLLGEVFSFSIWATVTSVAQTFSTNMMPSIVAAIAGTVQTAVYGAAATLNGYAYQLTNALSGLFLPKITRILYGEDPQQRLTRLGVRVGRILLCLSAVILVGFFCIGEEFFAVWMGDTYRQAYPCACFLLVGELAFNPFQIFDTAMTAEGYLRPQAFNRAFSSVVILSSGVVLAARLGAAGAALAISTGYLLRGVVSLMLYRKYLGVDVVRFVRQVYGMVLPYAVLALVLAQVMRLYTAHGWLGIAAKALVITAAFAAVSLLLVLTPEEKTFFRDTVRALLKKGETK